MKAVSATNLDARNLLAPSLRQFAGFSVIRTSSQSSSKAIKPCAMLPVFKVAIIGGGPAGCTLARLLLNAQIPTTIFEYEASPNVRSQGGTLDLHTATGLKALKGAGLYDEFVKYARYDGEALTVVDKNLKKYVSIDGSSKDTSGGRPEIDRLQLRQILLDSLPPGTIRWGCKFRSIDSELSLHFDHGIEKGYDLIVGADGAWSKVRLFLSHTQPVYSGVGGMEMNISDAEKHHPDLHKLVNRGSLFSYSDGKCIVAQQKSDGSLSVHAWSKRADEFWKKSCGYDISNPKEVKKALLQEYEGWAEPLIKFTQVADDDSIWAWSNYELPIGHKWNHRPGVTLIGDAAHLCSPFAGEGVNIAMEDALKLSQALIAAVKNPSSLDSRISAFEQDMFLRGAAVAQVSRDNMIDMLFTPGAPGSVIDRFARRAMLGTGWMQYLLPLWFVRMMLWVMRYLKGVK